MVGCVRDAIEPGGLPDGTCPASVFRAVSAPPYYAFLTTTGTLDTATAHRAAGAAALAAAHGPMTRLMYRP